MGKIIIQNVEFSAERFKETRTNAMEQPTIDETTYVKPARIISCDENRTGSHKDIDLIECEFPATGMDATQIKAHLIAQCQAHIDKKYNS